MKTMTKFASILILLFLATPVLLLSGCGSDVADKQGCPSGSYLANATDIIIGPAICYLYWRVEPWSSVRGSGAFLLRRSRSR